MACFSCVQQGTVQVVERFGKFNRVAYPGFNCLCPCLGNPAPLSVVYLLLRRVGEFVAGRINMRIRQLDVQVETKTLDNVFVHLVPKPAAFRL